MLRKKSDNKVVEVDFGNKQVVPNFDVSFDLGDKDWFLTIHCGLSAGQQLCFKWIDEFFDGDYILIQVGGGYYHGFGFYLTNSILIGQGVYHPYPRKKIERIGKLVSPAIPFK
jgi:hypothetical protein